MTLPPRWKEHFRKELEHNLFWTLLENYYFCSGEVVGGRPLSASFSCAARISSSCLLHRTSFKLGYNLFQNIFSRAHDTCRWTDSHKLDHAHGWHNRSGLRKAVETDRNRAGTVSSNSANKQLWLHSIWAGAITTVKRLVNQRLVALSYPQHLAS